MSEATGKDPAIAPILPTEPVPDVQGKKWTIVASGRIPEGVTGKVIVVESWTDPNIIKGSEGLLVGSDDEKLTADEVLELSGDKLKVSGYPKGADVYLKMSPEVEFPEGAEVIEFGVNAQQGGTGGFHPRRGILCVGPAHPAYAAANYAAQQGATDIKIVGLTERQKSLIQPFLDRLPREPDKQLRSEVKVTLA